MDIKLSLNWQINNDQVQDVDPVLFHLLESIQREGSLQHAVDEVGVSYRFGWGLLNKWELMLGQPLVILERGRGASLSSSGEKLLNANRQLSAIFSPDLDNFATNFKREFEAVLQPKGQAHLSIFASHGLAISHLRDLVHQASSFKFDLHFQGSLESLRALNEHNCDIAGFHIPVGELGKKLAEKYLSFLNKNTHQLIYVIKRNQGLIVSTGNPLNITNIQELINKKARFINRQKGSGTRLLFDQLLQNKNITSEQINGYHNEEFTHMAVAALVASGAADACFGISPMAEKFQLDFIPQIWEHYCLAVPNDLVDDERVLQIQQHLKEASFKDELDVFSGYETDHSGELTPFTDIFPSQ